MVSSAAALAEQVPGMTEDEAAVVPFFAKFFSHLGPYRLVAAVR